MKLHYYQSTLFFINKKQPSQRLTKKSPAKYSVQLTVNVIWPKYQKEEDEEERYKEQT